MRRFQQEQMSRRLKPLLLLALLPLISWYTNTVSTGMFHGKIRFSSSQTRLASDQLSFSGGPNGKVYTNYVKMQTSKLDSAQHHDNILRDDKNKIEPQLYERFFKYQKDRIVDFSGKNAVCVGARLGAEVRAMRRMGALAVGIDLNPGFDNPHVLLGDAHSVGFAPGSVDLVYTNVLDHILNLDIFFDSIANQLAQGGVFLIDLSKKAPDEFATNDFRQNKEDIISSLRRDFEIVYESDDQKPEPVWFYIARRKARVDGKVSGLIPATIIVGEPLNEVRTRALALRAQGLFVIAMSAGASKDNVVLACSDDLLYENQVRVEQIGMGRAGCAI